MIFVETTVYRKKNGIMKILEYFSYTNFKKRKSISLMVNIYQGDGSNIFNIIQHHKLKRINWVYRIWSY